MWRYKFNATHFNRAEPRQNLRASRIFNFSLDFFVITVFHHPA
jgi:hypothetical protein